MHRNKETYVEMPFCNDLTKPGWNILTLGAIIYYNPYNGGNW